LGSTPSGLSVDEAAIGYNAYSILETGKDEYGQSFPVLIKSFGDYKAPVYTYLLVPVYKLWGMNVFTTRSISAAAGVTGVPVISGDIGNLTLIETGLAERGFDASFPEKRDVLYPKSRLALTTAPALVAGGLLHLPPVARRRLRQPPPNLRLLLGGQGAGGGGWVRHRVDPERVARAASAAASCVPGITWSGARSGRQRKSPAFRQCLFPRSFSASNVRPSSSRASSTVIRSTVHRFAERLQAATVST